MSINFWGNNGSVRLRIISTVLALAIIWPLFSTVVWTENARSTTTSALSINADVPNGLGPQTAGTITLHFTNTGTADMPAPLLVLQGSGNALLTLDQSKSGQALISSAYPSGFTSTIQVIASGATSGILKAGESASIPVYFCGLLKPWDTSQTQINFGLSSFETSNTDTVDWTSLQNSMRPSSISSDAWNPIWSNFTANMGNTWGQYVSRLDQDVIYLADLGENVQDAENLLSFEIEQANGLGSLNSLESVTDDSITAPGLPITFSRSYPTTISQRYSLGPLGRSWSHSWQYSLTQAADSSVTIDGPAGSKRSFSPNGSGGFTPQPGDYGTLVATGGGAFILTEKDGSTKGFSADSKLSYVQDTNGNRVTCAYTSGLLTNLTHSSGETLAIVYNASGRITSIIDPSKGTTSFSYDVFDEHLISVTDYKGKTTSYGYITGHGAVQEHALSEIDYPGGNHRYFTYDSNGSLSGASKDGNSEALSYSYGTGGEVDSTDTTGATSKKFMDHKGLTLKTVDPLGNETKSTYDSNYNLTSFTDPTNKSYSYSYDSQGNMTSSTDPTDHKTLFSYGALNRMTALQDANGNQTNYGYDANGNMDSITYANSISESWNYDANGNPTAKTNGRGHVIHYGYDSEGRVISKSYADGSHFTYSYDSAGNIIATTDPTGTTNFTYANDLLSRIDYPGGRFLQFTYNDASRRTQSIDQLGHTLNYNYDNVGRLESIINEDSKEIVHYAYDPVGRLTSKMVGNGDYTTFEYDAASQMLQLINYKQDGSVLSRFDYTYDNRGRRTSMATIDGSWNYEYDDLGQLTHAVFTSTNSDIANQNLTYAYDPMGNRTLTIENGATISYTTNNMNQYTQTQAARAGDLPLSLTLTQIYWASYSDYLMRQLSVDVRVSNPTTINASGMQITNCFSTNGVTVSSALPAGNVDIPAGGTGTITLKYEVPAGVSNFRSSFWGNAKDTTGATHLYPGDTTDGTTNNIFDADGNLLTETSAAGMTSYRYNDENRLTGVTSPFESSQYIYDANGNRVNSTDNGLSTSYIVDPIGLGNVVGEYDAAGNLKDRYDYGLGLLSQTDSSHGTNYYNFDASGNTSELTGSDGNIVTKFQYDPYGKQLISDNISNNFQFDGEDGVKKELNGNYSMRNRAYIPQMGRFISRDAVGIAQQINLYSYSGNDPVNRKDPRGLFFDIFGLGMIANDFMNIAAVGLGAFVPGAELAAQGAIYFNPVVDAAALGIGLGIGIGGAYLALPEIFGKDIGDKAQLFVSPPLYFFYHGVQSIAEWWFDRSNQFSAYNGASGGGGGTNPLPSNPTQSASYFSTYNPVSGPVIVSVTPSGSLSAPPGGVEVVATDSQSGISNVTMNIDNGATIQRSSCWGGCYIDGSAGHYPAWVGNMQWNTTYTVSGTVTDGAGNTTPYSTSFTTPPPT